MNTLSTWIVSASEDLAARVLWLTVIGTVLLGGLGLSRSSADSPPAVEAQGPVVTATTREEGTQAPAREPGVVSGEVVDAESLVPVAGAEVLLRDTRLHRAKAETDPARLAAISGTLLDHRRNPVAGVQLRLIVSKSASTGDDDNRFNWLLIDTGQLGQNKYVAQFLSTVTDARGRFAFRDLLPGMYVQLAYWGPNAPKSRSLAFAKTKAGVAQTVTIDVPEPAKISGSFDARTFPHSGSIQLSRKDDAFHTYESELAAGQAEFRFENLPSGDYSLYIMHQPERNTDDPAMYTLRPIASRSLTVEPGGTYKVQFTENDRVDRQER